MSQIGCLCADKELALLGRPSCVFNIKTTRRLVYMHLRKADGTRNYIDVTAGAGADFDSAYWNGLLTNSDPRLRLYLSADLENVTHPNTEATMEEFSSGAMAETRSEFLGFEGFQVGAESTPAQFAQLRKNKCQDVGVFYVDATGSIFGDASDWADGKLYPIPLMRGSFRTDALLPTDDAVGKIQVRFIHDFYKFNYGNLGGVQSNLMEVNPMELLPVMPVNGVTSSPTTADVVLTLSTNFIEGVGYSKITGLVAADFTLEDDGGTPVAIASVAEGADGVYTITATMPAGDYTVGIDVEGHLMAPVTFTTA
jgi:hypothetical protein